MKRSRLLRKTRLKRGKGPKRTARLDRSTRIAPVNRKRKKARYEKCFGPKSEWMREAYPCCVVTGDPGGWFFKVEHAHVLGTRGAGADESGIVPLRMDVHDHFDGSMTDARFEETWKVSREWIRNRAREIHNEWECVA